MAHGDWRDLEMLWSFQKGGCYIGWVLLHVDYRCYSSLKIMYQCTDTQNHFFLYSQEMYFSLVYWPMGFMKFWQLPTISVLDFILVWSSMHEKFNSFGVWKVEGNNLHNTSFSISLVDSNPLSYIDFEGNAAKLYKLRPTNWKQFTI